MTERDGSMVLERAPALAWTEPSLRSYLESLGYRPVGEIRQTDLGGEGAGIKGFGYGQPVLVEFETEGRRKRLVLHTLSSNAFGHDRPSDRAESLLLSHHTFNRLTRHVRSVDVGAFSGDGQMISLGRSGEFFLLTEFATGELYARDLERMRDTGRREKVDEERTIALARYLASIHRQKQDAPLVYHRRIRDLVGHGEGILGLTDSYAPDFAPGGAAFLKRVEHAAIDWRFRLRDRTHRLSQVHGDFHPFNILFEPGTEFRLLDRSRGEWGEPADDVTALSINYLFFALQSKACFEGPLRFLFELFWDTYLAESADGELLEAAPPFLAWRGLVLASPLWYPTIGSSVRVLLMRFIENVLADPHFDPTRVDVYLRRWTV